MIMVSSMKVIVLDCLLNVPINNRFKINLINVILNVSCTINLGTLKLCRIIFLNVHKMEIIDKIIQIDNSNRSTFATSILNFVD